MARKQQGLTQVKLAKPVDVSRSFIGLVVCGMRKASLETLEEICRALNISMDAVAMLPHDGLALTGYSKDHIKKAYALLEAALDMCE